MGISQAVEASAAGRVQNPYSSRPNWLYPTVVVVVLTAFALYAFLVGVFETTGRFGPYLSPFFSPEIEVRVGGFLIPPGIWIAPFPLAFRLTCYYYRKAIFRAYLWHPRACAVAEPGRGQYRGETRFWVFNNLHRFALYLILVQTAILQPHPQSALQIARQRVPRIRLFEGFVRHRFNRFEPLLK